MHPLYDTHGVKGCQLILPADHRLDLPERLAWVHSICAFFIGSHGPVMGSVYLCDEDGNFGSADYSANGSGGKKNQSARQKSNVSDHILKSGHHFVMAHVDDKGCHDAWTKYLRDLRKLKCFLCGEKDGLRVPVQCSAGRAKEFPRFRKIHGVRRRCVNAMHIGCAKWRVNNVSKDGVQSDRVYYYPGTQTGTAGKHRFPVTECYCNDHADIVFKYLLKEKGEGSSINVRIIEKGAEGQSNSEGTIISSQEEKETVSTRTEKVESEAIGPHSPSARRDGIAFDSAHKREVSPKAEQCFDSANHTEEATVHVNVSSDNTKPSCGEIKAPEAAETFSVSTAQNKTVTEMDDPKKASRMKFEDIKNELSACFKMAQEQGLGLSERKQILLECKSKWKERFTVDGNVSQEEFKKSWSRVIRSLQQELLGVNANGASSSARIKNEADALKPHLAKKADDKPGD